jgi:hypothetical protein
MESKILRIYLCLENPITKQAVNIDGNLYLFGELLTTLSDAARQLSQADPAPVALPAEDPKHEAAHVTG